jgi:hypothetical protein
MGVYALLCEALEGDERWARTTRYDAPLCFVYAAYWRCLKETRRPAQLSVKYVACPLPGRVGVVLAAASNLRGRGTQDVGVYALRRATRG